MHALIRDGAKLVTQATDVVEELRPDIRALLSTKPSTIAAQDEELDPVERNILDHLTKAQDAVDVDTLLERTDVPIPLALAACRDRRPARRSRSYRRDCSSCV